MLPAEPARLERVEPSVEDIPWQYRETIAAVRHVVSADPFEVLAVALAEIAVFHRGVGVGAV